MAQVVAEFMMIRPRLGEEIEAMNALRILMPIVTALTIHCGSSGAIENDEYQYRVIHRFGIWSLIVNASETFLSLSEASSHLTLVCSAGLGPYNLHFVVTDENAVGYDPRIKKKTYAFTAWADSQPPKDFVLPIDEADRRRFATTFIFRVKEGEVLPNQELWLMMKSATKAISYSTPAGTHTIDATHLRSAIYKFEELCEKINPPRNR